MEIARTDIRDLNEFTKYGDRFTKVASYPDRNIYVYKREHYDEERKIWVCIVFEVVKGAKCINPDGTIVYAYPSSEKFGPLGKCLSNNWFSNRMIIWLIDNPDKWDPESVVNIKKTFKYDEPDLDMSSWSNYGEF